MNERAQELAAPPVFVGGINRSGTTLMARVLGSNSALAVPPTEFLFFGKSGPKPPADRAEFDHRLGEILRWPRVREWGLDDREVLARSRSWPPTRSSLFILPLDAYRRRLGKARLGEKSVLNEFRLEALGDWFSDYRVVQMIREPIAAYGSGHAGRPLDARQAIRWGRLWASSAAVGMRRVRADPTRHRLVRYEDLTAKPRVTVASVCEFAGVAFEDEAMLGLAAYEAKENSSFSAWASGTYEGAIRRSDDVDRLNAVHPQERAALAAVCEPAAAELGYRLDRRRRSFDVAVALAAEWSRPRARLRSLLGFRAV